MRKFVIALLVAVSTLCSYAQTVTTYAGSQYLGSGQYLSTPNNALKSEFFSMPAGIAIDTNGKIWVTDQHNIHILEQGMSRIRGGYLGDPGEPGSVGEANGTGTVSRFNAPGGMCVHPKTNEIFIADRDNGLIRKGSAFVNVSNGTIWSTYAGTYSFAGEHQDGTLATAKFYTPSDVVCTSNGTLYVADLGNDCIRKITPSQVTTYAGKAMESGFVNGSVTNARFYSPEGLYLENDNSLLVADRNNGAIRRINLTTNQVTTVCSGLFAPTDIVEAEGAIYIADGSAIKVWDGTTIRIYAGDTLVPGYKDADGTVARFEFIFHMAYDKANKVIYVIDQGNNVVRRIPVGLPPVADFTASSTSPTVGQTVVLTSTSQFATSYNWSITPGSYSLLNGSKLTDGKIFVMFNAATNYTVTLTASNGVGQDIETKTNYINVSNVAGELPSVSFYADRTVVNTGELVSLIETSGNAPKTWLWEITPNTFKFLNNTGDTSRFPVISFDTAGVYTVKLTVTNNNGSNNYIRANYITVNKAVNTIQWAPSVISATIYPNPTSNAFALKGIQGEGTLQLLDLSGRTVFEYNGELSQSFAPALPSGTYLVRAAIGNHFYQGRLLKVQP